MHKIDYMIYLESFMLPPENRQVYPYKQMYDKEGLEVIDFAPITIFYGSNGSGKSTLLNIIASKVGVNNKTLGNTSEYFDGVPKIDVEECLRNGYISADDYRKTHNKENV